MSYVSPVPAWRRSRLAVTILGATLLAGPGVAVAQTNIDRQLDQATRPGIDSLPQAPLSERILIGREDLVVLKQRPFFTLYAGTSYNFTDNANFSRSNRQRDAIFSTSAGLRFATQIAETVDVFAQIGYFGSRYQKTNALNYDGGQGKIGFSLPKLPGGLRLTASYEPSVIYDMGFGKRKLLQNALNLSLSRDFEVLPKLTLTPLIGVGYLPSDPSDYTGYVVRGGVSAIYFLRPTLALLASIDVSHRTYTNYFPAVYTTARRDTVLAASTGILWAPLEQVSLIASVNYNRGDSTLSPFSYRATGLTPTAQLSMRF
jgi:hypothetical protein